MARAQSVIPISAARRASEGRSPFIRLMSNALTGANHILLDTIKDVEGETVKLSDLFRTLIENSSDQTDELHAIVDTINVVKIKDGQVELQDVPQVFQRPLEEITERILILSKQGVSLIYSLDEILEEVEELGSCVTEIEAINRQSRLLSLNAQIEAGRAGVHGVGFQVVAHEMHTLSKRIDSLSERMRKSLDIVRNNIHEVIEEIRTEYNKLNEIGAMDISKQVDAKERLQDILQSIADKNKQLAHTLDNSASTSRGITDSINKIITTMQFQDRMRQRTDAIIDVLDAILGFLQRQDTTLTDPTECDTLCQTILSGITLSDVRAQFEEALLGEVVTHIPPPSTSDDDNIELF